MLDLDTLEFPISILLLSPFFIKGQASERKIELQRKSLILNRWVYIVDTEARWSRNPRRKKKLLKKTYQCYKASNLLRKNEFVNSLVWHETNFCWVFLSKVWISEVYLESSRKSLINCFAKLVNGFQPITIFANKLHHRCSTRF